MMNDDILLKIHRKYTDSELVAYQQDKIKKLQTEIGVLKSDIAELEDKYDKLKKDWTFTLHAEYRNEKVLKDYMGLVGSRLGWLKKENYEEYPPHPICPINQDDKKYYSIFNKFNDDKYWKDVNIWKNTDVEYLNCIKEWSRIYENEKNNLVKTIEVTIPKGCILTVDRIYIRKGAKAYDSVSFWVEGLIPNKKVRFWVSLNDANNIEYK